MLENILKLSIHLKIHLVEAVPAIYQRGLKKHRKAYGIQTCLSVTTKPSVRINGTIPCFVLGAHITPSSLIFDFSFFLILAPAGGSNPAGP